MDGNKESCAAIISYGAALASELLPAPAALAQQKPAGSLQPRPGSPPSQPGLAWPGEDGRGAQA